jgi:N-ethylmaleimide reductase
MGLCLSPQNQYNAARCDDPAEVTEYLSKQLSDRRLAYFHLMRADFFGRKSSVDLLKIARQNITNGALIGNMGYTPAEAETAVATAAVDAVAFGTSFLANPDLARILKERDVLQRRTSEVTQRCRRRRNELRGRNLRRSGRKRQKNEAPNLQCFEHTHIILMSF